MLRSTPMKRTAMKPYRPRPAVSSAAKDGLTGRSGGWCEPQLPGCTGRATDACHRIGRKAGGRSGTAHEGLANVWHGCRTCHRWATLNPAEAYDLGLALHEWQDPEREPIVYHGSWRLLRNDGTVAEYADAPPPAGVA